MVNVLEINREDFKLSNDASERIKVLLKNEEGSFFRISVLGGGCSGFQYDFSFEKNPFNDDLVFDATDVKYLIDKVSIDFIKGSSLELFMRFIKWLLRVMKLNLLIKF